MPSRCYNVTLAASSLNDSNTGRLYITLSATFICLPTCPMCYNEASRNLTCCICLSLDDSSQTALSLH